MGIDRSLDVGEHIGTSHPAAVSRADLKLLLDVVGEANALEDLPQFRSESCRLLARLVPYDIAGYNEIRRGETFSLLTRPVSEQLLAQFTALAYQNPLIARFEQTRDGRPYRISDVMDRKDFQQLELYTRFCREVGIEFQLAFTLPSSPPLIIGLVLCREHDDFSDRDVRLLALARPHLIQAYRAAETRSATQALFATLESGLAVAGRDLVVLDAQGRVEFASDGARRLLGDSGLARLPSTVEAWLAQRHPERRVLEPLPLDRDGRRLVIHLLPVQRQDQRTVLLVRTQELQPTPAALTGLGLTRREAETLSRIAKGDPPATAAQQMGIARRTLDKHLQNAYAKLGVTGREEAITTARAAVGTEWPPAPE